MAESYRDISGPVTSLTLFNIKPEYVEAVAEYMKENVKNLLQSAKEGKVPGFLHIECERYGNTFVSWEKYSNPDAVERVIPVRYMEFKHHPLADAFDGFTAKEEYANKIAQYMSDDIANQLRLAEEGKLPGLISIHGVRDGVHFASWEKYVDADAVEKVVLPRYKIVRDEEIAKGFLVPPNLQFFGTNSLPPPNQRP